MKLYIIIILAVIAFSVSACKKDAEEYSTIPEISFKDFIIYTSSEGTTDSLAARINFTDGDGDIGLHQYDSIPAFDFISKIYEKQNGSFVLLSPPIPPNFRLPYITPSGFHKSVKGLLSVNFISFPLKRGADTLKYEIYILDRSLHKSNVITTPEVIINLP